MRIDKRFLTRPRDGGFTLKYKLPKELEGQPNPKTGKPMGKTLHLGLGTSDLREAAHRRDVIIGQLREMQEELRRSGRFSTERAVELGKRWQRGETIVQSDDGPDPDLAMDMVRDDAQEIEETEGPEAAERWFNLASGNAALFSETVDRYIKAREQDLKKATINDLRTEKRRFLEWAGEAVTLQEVDRAKAYSYAAEHLPTLTTPRAPKGLSRATRQRAVSLLSGVWQWARKAGVLPYESDNPWRDLPLPTERTRLNSPAQHVLRRQASVQHVLSGDEGCSPSRWLRDESETTEGIFSPDQWSRLMKACPAGEPLGDLLRIALVTGCRRDEIACRSAAEVLKDGSGFIVPDGKTENARRFVPLHEGTAAHDVVKRRFNAGHDLFPELPVRPSNGYRGGPLTQRFTRVRREVLGEETDGVLKLHSTRSTWRTIAGRAGVSVDAIDQLGGWKAQGSTGTTVYNRGLAREQLREASWKVIERFREEGYEV